MENMDGVNRSTVDFTSDSSGGNLTVVLPRSCTLFNKTQNTTIRPSNCADDAFDYSYEGDGWVNPFSILHIRALFIAAYSIVFCVCVVGNAAVIFVILRSRRMRSITNFFLANLAFADFCVGIFCILPTLKTYLDTIWTLGRVMCKLNYFVQQMAFVASVTILTVIAIERYVDIVYPMKSKQLTTRKRLILFIVLIWSIAIFYNVIQLVIFDTEGTEFEGVRFEFCIITVKFDRKTYYTCNFFLWYLIPLVLMCAIYTKIAVVLWKSTMLTSSHNTPTGSDQNGPSFGRTRFPRHNRNQLPGETIHMTKFKQMEVTSIGSTNALLVRNGSQSSFNSILGSKEMGSQTWGSGPTGSQYGVTGQTGPAQKEGKTDTSYSGKTCPAEKGTNSNYKKPRTQEIAQKSKTSGGGDNVLKSRRKVVRLLLLVVSTFAACSITFQVRVLMQAWGGNVPSMVPPIAVLLMFSNSGLNPILYAFFSENFRRAMKEVFVCKRLSSRPSFRRDPLTSRTSAVTNSNV